MHEYLLIFDFTETYQFDSFGKFGQVRSGTEKLRQDFIWRLDYAFLLYPIFYGSTVFVPGRDQSVKVLPLWVHMDQGDASVKVLPLFTPHSDKMVTITVQYHNKDMIVGLLVGPSVGRVGKPSSKIMGQFISH